MGCTSGIAATPCEYPAMGYNCGGIEESVDPKNGNFLMKCHPNCSWKWIAENNTRSKQKIFYIFPVLADQIAGIYVSFNCMATGNPSHDPVLIQLEMVKSDQRTIHMNLLARASDTAAKVEANISSKSSIIQQASKGDVCRLKCSNIREGTEVHISQLTAFITSKDGYSCVRLPFEEIIKEWKKSSRRQVLSLRSFKVWQLRSIKAPIGWTQTPPLQVKPSSIDGIIEFDIVFDSSLERNESGSPIKTRKNSIRSNQSSPTKAPASPEGKKPNSEGETPKKSLSPSRRLSSIENSLGLSATPDSFGEVRFSINLVRNNTIIMSYIIIDQKRLQIGANRIAFHINDKLSTPLLKLFRPGDYYQIDRYHAREDVILQVNHFHIKIMSTEKRALCATPHRWIRLPADNRQLVSVDDELTSVEAEEDRETKLEYDSFFYITPQASQYPVEDVGDDPIDLYGEIHHGKRRGPHRPQSGWGSWIEQE